MELHELGMTALRALGVYALMLVVIRLSGKRTIGNFTAFDLLVALMLGEIVDEIIYGDVTFLQGTVAIATIAIAQQGNAWLSYYDHGMDRILEGAPSILVRDGAMQRKGMRKERMSEKDVMEELRLNGVEDIREVRLAIMENDGEVSVLRHEWAEPVRRADLGGEWEKERNRTLDGRGEPSDDERSDSDTYLGRK